MSNIRCMYCARYYRKIKNDNKCKDCNLEFDNVVKLITKRYSGALKGLVNK